MIFTLDSAYLATPTSSIPRSLVDNEIRQFKYAIRERMSVEHEWNPSSTTNEGWHKAGSVTVCDTGDEAARDAVVTPQNGSLFVMTDGSDKRLQLYVDGSWEDISTLDHDLLTGRTDNDHPQYVLKEDGSMSGPLDMGGFVLKTGQTTSTYGQFVLHQHRDDNHPTMENIDAVAAGAVTLAKLSTNQASTTTSVSVGETVSWSAHAFDFFPQVYVLYSSAAGFWIHPALSYYGLAVHNSSFVARDVRIRREWVA